MMEYSAEQFDGVPKTDVVRIVELEAENAHLQARVEEAEETRRASVNEVIREKEAVEEKLRCAEAQSEQRREALELAARRIEALLIGKKDARSQHPWVKEVRAAIDISPEEAREGR